MNLEVLRLRYCTDLSKLPESIKSLNNLRLLDISDCLRLDTCQKRLVSYVNWSLTRVMHGKIQINVLKKFIFFNSSSSRLMKVIRLIPNIHVLKQQI